MAALRGDGRRVASVAGGGGEGRVLIHERNYMGDTQTTIEPDTAVTIHDGPRNVPTFANDDDPLTTIARVAASGASRETIEQIKGLVEWRDKRDAEAAFNAAFSKARSQFKKARKSGFNSFLNQHYPTIEDLNDATSEALQSNGLSWRHSVRTEGEMTHVKCIIAHEKGHHESCEMHAKSDCMVAQKQGKEARVNDLQSTKQVVTYLRRTTLGAMLGIVDGESDNDGNTPIETITDDQALQIEALVGDVGADAAKFLDWLGVEKFADIPAAKFKQAIDALKRKARKQS